LNIMQMFHLSAFSYNNSTILLQSQWCSSSPAAVTSLPNTGIHLCAAQLLSCVCIFFHCSVKSMDVVSL
jgi:hypothetical protein